MPAKQLLTIFEFILILTVFALIGSFEITVQENDRIVDATEQFTELVRYKGCITKQMYEDFREQISTPIKVNFIVEKGKTLKQSDELLNANFTEDVLEHLDASGLYAMSAGDEIKVVVRKLSPTSFDRTVGMLTGQMRGGANPVIAIKGGLVLNEQYH